MVVLRLKRLGRRHRPFYRVNAMDKRAPRNGRVIEELGWFDPVQIDETKQHSLKTDRIDYWLSVGAQPSDTVRSLLKRAGIDPTPGKKLAASKD
jgi:small subunit ribosomal protein S16